MDGIEEEFSPDQILAYFLNADLKDENTWNSFTEIIITFVEFFTSLIRTEVLIFFLNSLMKLEWIFMSPSLKLSLFTWTLRLNSKQEIYQI